jgi:3-oxoadipate enol-lactonase
LNLAQAAMGLKKHLEESGIKEPIVLGGISMGGYWAMEFVRQFPENVKKLILISTKAGVDKPEALQKRLDMADKVEKEGTEFLVQAMVPSLLGKTTHEQKKDVVQILVQWIRGTKPQAVALAQRAMANRRDQRDFLPKITHPTLVLAGAEDTLIPVSEAESMAKTIFESHLEILDHVGHLVPLENPIQFQKIVNEFLAK